MDFATEAVDGGGCGDVSETVACGGCPKSVGAGPFYRESSVSYGRITRASVSADNARRESWRAHEFEQLTDLRGVDHG